MITGWAQYREFEGTVEGEEKDYAYH